MVLAFWTDQLKTLNAFVGAKIYSTRQQGHMSVLGTIGTKVGAFDMKTPWIPLYIEECCIHVSDRETWIQHFHVSDRNMEMSMFQIVDLDMKRNRNREALSALKHDMADTGQSLLLPPLPDTHPWLSQCTTTVYSQV